MEFLNESRIIHMEKLTEGKIVHYVNEKGTHLPAMIVHISHFPESITDNVICNLKVFLDKEGDDMWLPSIYFDAAKRLDTWHWVE